MARGKVKDWTKEITEVDEWNKIIQTDKLICAEIYSSWFGYCEVYTPIIDKIMSKNEKEQEKTIWTRLNIAAIEKENNDEPLKYLEKWTKYESPKPLYVFIKNKQVITTITEANAGKMNETVIACFKGEEIIQKPMDDDIQILTSPMMKSKKTDEQDEKEDIQLNEEEEITNDSKETPEIKEENQSKDEQKEEEQKKDDAVPENVETSQ